MGRSVLKKKRVLITAGPTWVPIDDVRVLSNVSSGQLGLLLAQEAVKLGFKTDLFLGPVCGNIAFRESLKLFRFRYFDELFSLIKSNLSVKKYDLILHCAAVSDYVCVCKNGKISSEKEALVLRFKKAPKLIHLIRRLNPRALLVMFKLESGVKETELIKRALSAMKCAKADLTVANYFKGQQYKGFILDGHGNIITKAFSRQEMARNLFGVFQKGLVR